MIIKIASNEQTSKGAAYDRPPLPAQKGFTYDLVIIIIDVMMFIPKMFFHFREKQSAKHVEPKQALKRTYAEPPSAASLSSAAPLQPNSIAFLS